MLGRPDLWPTAARQAVALAPPGWWRGWPPSPAPDPEYLRFRLLTQYGDPAHDPEPGDLVRYLRWCRAVRRRARG